MNGLKYTVSIDGISCAEHMTLEYALMLTEAIFAKFYAEALETGMSVKITSEAQGNDGRCRRCGM